MDSSPSTARQSGIAGDDTLGPRAKSAVNFLVSHGPNFGVEGWEEQTGHSPSTIAAEIASLEAAATIADLARGLQARTKTSGRKVRIATVAMAGPERVITNFRRCRNSRRHPFGQPRREARSGRARHRAA